MDIERSCAGCDEIDVAVNAAADVNVAKRRHDSDATSFETAEIRHSGLGGHVNGVAFQTLKRREQLAKESEKSVNQWIFRCERCTTLFKSPH